MADLTLRRGHRHGTGPGSALSSPLFAIRLAAPVGVPPQVFGISRADMCMAVVNVRVVVDVRPVVLATVENGATSAPTIIRKTERRFMEWGILRNCSQIVASPRVTNC
jgi:hypothetical protein